MYLRKKILVSQPKPLAEKSPYFDIAEKYGVQIEFRPFIKVDPVNAKEFRAQRINILDYTAVIFTSKTAIDHFFRLCDEMRITVPKTMKYFCISESIAVYLQKYIVFRKRKIFFPASGKVEDLTVQAHKHHKDETYLIPAADVHKDNLLRMLDDKKVNYQVCIMYRTVSNDFGEEEAFDYDVLLFFSPAGISSLLKNFPNFEQKEIAIGTFGPTTAQAVRNAGLRLDIEAPNPEAPSMTTALENYLKALPKSIKK
ncbi:MAG: uroporphyrinogen-III synthase [Candidatus Symbiothrix sp.]|jgi:uroporphyrinogen-III synthase|nr:uroporphyrinogen-III synthase [Candidatus Symbiothrix sp.]